MPSMQDWLNDDSEALRISHQLIKSCMIKDLEKEYQNISNLAEWMKSNGLKSHDPFDIQSSRPYIWLISHVGMADIARYLLFGMEKCTPFLSKLLVEKRKAATTSAVYADACLKMYGSTKNPKWLYDGCDELDWLVDNVSPGYHGACWGLPFDWAMGDGVIAKTGTPYSTIIIYMIDALVAGYKATNNKKYLDCAVSTIGFFTRDLHQEVIDEDTICSAYSPVDRLQVINVNSYVAVALYELYQYSKDDESIEYANKLLNFVLKAQHGDGSWPYTVNGTMVDSLHQCYIIENLFRCYQVNGDKKLLDAAERGVICFYDNFYDAGTIRKLPQSDPKSKYYDLELMDASETVAMCERLLLEDVFEPQSDVAIKLRRMRSDVFYTTERVFRLKDKPYYKSKVRKVPGDIPYMRWGESQWLYAMATRYERKTREVKEY